MRPIEPGTSGKENHDPSQGPVSLALGSTLLATVGMLAPAAHATPAAPATSTAVAVPMDSCPCNPPSGIGWNYLDTTSAQRLRRGRPAQTSTPVVGLSTSAPVAARSATTSSGFVRSGSRHRLPTWGRMAPCSRPAPGKRLKNRFPANFPWCRSGILSHLAEDILGPSRSKEFLI